MANRTVSSLNDKIREDEINFTAGESSSDWPCNRPELLDSSDELVESNKTKLRQLKMKEVTKGISNGNTAADPMDWYNLFTNMVDFIKESIEVIKEENKVFRENLKTEIKIEIETEFKKSAEVSQRLNKEFLDRLHSETSKCTHSIGLAQRNKTELVAVTKKIQALPSQTQAETAGMITERGPNEFENIIKGVKGNGTLINGAESDEVGCVYVVKSKTVPLEAVSRHDRCLYKADPQRTGIHNAVPAVCKEHSRKRPSEGNLVRGVPNGRTLGIGRQACHDGTWNRDSKEERRHWMGKNSDTIFRKTRQLMVEERIGGSFVGLRKLSDWTLR
jgi:hypothetical protein